MENYTKEQKINKELENMKIKNEDYENTRKYFIVTININYYIKK